MVAARSSPYNLRSGAKHPDPYATYEKQGHKVTRYPDGHTHIKFNSEVFEREDRKAREDEERRREAAARASSSKSKLRGSLDDAGSPDARERSVSVTSTLTWPSDDEEAGEGEEDDGNRTTDELADPRFVTPDLSGDNLRLPGAPRKAVAFSERRDFSLEPTPTPMPPAGGPFNFSASFPSIKEEDLQDFNLMDVDGSNEERTSAIRNRSLTPYHQRSPPSGSSTPTPIAGPSTPRAGPSRYKVFDKDGRNVTSFFDKFGWGEDEEVDTREEVAARTPSHTPIPVGPTGTEIIDPFGTQATTLKKRGTVDARWYRYTIAPGGTNVRTPQV